VGMEIISHLFLTTALEAHGYIHIPTVLPTEKAAVYKTWGNVLQGTEDFSNLFSFSKLRGLYSRISVP